MNMSLDDLNTISTVLQMGYMQLKPESNNDLTTLPRGTVAQKFFHLFGKLVTFFVRAFF